MTTESLNADVLVRLLRQMSHDMRSILGTLTTTSDMFAAGIYGELSPKQARAVARLQRGSYRLVTLLDDVMAYIKAEADQFPLFPVSFAPRKTLESVEQTTRPVVEAKGLTLNIEIAESVPETFVGDEKVIQRIILALVWNAIAFTEKGTVTLSSRWETDKGWVIQVTDQGPGISPDAEAHIFEPFWRGSEARDVPTSGFGLGLAMALALTKLMKGHLCLESSSAAGSTFYGDFPVEPASD